MLMSLGSLISGTGTAVTIWDRFGDNIKLGYKKLKYGKNIGTYYFDEYVKLVRLLYNGNAIAITHIRLKILDKEQFQIINRKLNIEDAHKDTKFSKKLRELTKTDTLYRYRRMGFWHSNKEILSVTNNRRYKDNKEITWKFKFDVGAIESDSISFCYAFSIPKFYPIHEGLWDKDGAPLDSSNTLSTSLKVKHLIKRFRYILYLDRKIDLDRDPQISIIPEGSDLAINRKNVPPSEENDVFFKKYESVIKFPQRLSTIKLDFTVNKEV